MIQFNNCFGGHSEKETPGPIPNPEVKLLSADGTAAGTLWETRTPPDQHLQERAPTPTLGAGCSLFFSCPDTPSTPGETNRENRAVPASGRSGHEKRTPPHPRITGLVARESCSARFWSVRSRKTHINPTSFLTGPGEQILLPTDDVSAHTPGIPP